MPVVRFSRDKRGYEHVYLVDAKDRGRSRVLYWFRTPPGVKVGRSPFDPDTQRALEAQNPDLRFDWPQIVAAKMPPPAPVEAWREKRRAERAVRRARTDEAVAAQPVPPENMVEAALPEPEPLTIEMGDGQAPRVTQVVEVELATGEPLAAPRPDATGGEPTAARRRRRRGGRRRRKPHAGSGGPPAGETGDLDQTDSAVESSNEE